MCAQLREVQKAASDEISRVGRNGPAQALLTHNQPASEHNSSASYRHQQAAEQPTRRHLGTGAQWARNVLIVSALTATMIIWIIFLAWAWTRLLALL